jgi:hypothetical protein
VLLTILLILTFVNITGDFSLSITGTANGDSGIVNLVLVMLKVEDPPIVTQTATLLANFNKEIKVLIR